MFKKLTNPLTTASSLGVALRYISTIVGSIITILAIVGWLTQEQVAELNRMIEQISLQVPGLVAAISGLVPLIITLYAILTKSSSDKAAAAAKKIDAELPPSAPVIIKTPDGVPDIKVLPPGK